MPVININTIGGSMAGRIERGSGSMRENVERFKDQSVNMGKQAIQTGNAAETGMIRQTETYQGYTKTLRPATSVAKSGVTVMATISAMQLTKDYKRFNKEHGEEIQKYIDSLKPKNNEGMPRANSQAIIANVEDKNRIIKRDTFNDITSKDKNGNPILHKEVTREKILDTRTQKPITVGDWNKRSMFGSRLNNNISIATKHSRTKLADDGAIHCYRRNPSKAVSQAKKLEKELKRRELVRDFNMGNVRGGRLAAFKTSMAIRTERKLDKKLARSKIIHSHMHNLYSKSDNKISSIHDSLQITKGRLFRNSVPRQYDSTRISIFMKRHSKAEDDIIKNGGKKVKGVNIAKDVNLTDGDILLQIAGKKGMAAKGAKDMARSKRLSSLRQAKLAIIRATGVTKNNDFGEGYQASQKVLMVGKPLVNKMALKAYKKMLIKTGKIAGGILNRVAVEVGATGVHTYKAYNLAKSGGGVQAGNFKTARAMYRQNHRLAKEQTKGAINYAKSQTKGAVTHAKDTVKGATASSKKAVKRTVKRATRRALSPVLRMTAPLRRFILRSLSKFSNTTFAKGAGLIGRGVGHVLSFAGKALSTLFFKPLMSLFRGLSALFSTVSSFIFGAAFIYAIIFALIMSSGSLLSGVYGIFDSIENAATEAWANTEPNVNYAVDEIQEASRDLSNVTKMQEDVAVIASIIDKLPATQLWRKLTKQEIDTCAGYEIIVIGDTDQYTLEIPAAGNTINYQTIEIKKRGGMVQENDREILSIVSNLYDSYGGISNTFNIGKQIEKSQWKLLIQQLYILSHSTNIRKEPFTLDNYSVNYWSGEKTVTSSSTYYKWMIEVEILRGNEFFNKTADVALAAGKKIDSDIEIDTKEQLHEYFLASMEKDDLWDANSEYKYKGYEYTYFDASSGILANIAKHFNSTPQSQYTYEYSNPPENIYIVDSDDKNNSLEYVRVVEREDGSYDTTGGVYKIENGSMTLETVFTSDKEGYPSKKEQEYIDKYLKENDIEVEEETKKETDKKEDKKESKKKEAEKKGTVSKN